MKLKIYAVFDVKAAAFANPFFQVNEVLAVRAVSGAVRDPSSVLSKFPDDFQLFELGSFDDETGSVSPVNPVRCVCTLSSLRGQDG